MLDESLITDGTPVNGLPQIVNAPAPDWKLTRAPPRFTRSLDTTPPPAVAKMSGLPAAGATDGVAPLSSRQFPSVENLASPPSPVQMYAELRATVTLAATQRFDTPDCAGSKSV